MSDLVAIVGMAGRFPNAANVHEFWNNLVAGRECLGATERISGIDGRRDGAHWVEADCTLPGADLFDAEFFGMNPRECEITDPQHRLLLELAWEAVENAGFKIPAHGASVGVFAGGHYTSYFRPPAELNVLEILPQMIGTDKDYLATRVSHRLNFTGPSITVQSACSTSLASVHLACQAIIGGECEAALAGGVAICTPHLRRQLYLPGGMLSPDGYCRAFDADARGTIFTEGGGVVMLMPFDDAIAKRMNVYAVIRGSAMNNDGGMKGGYSAPSLEGQIRVLRQAHAASGVRPEDFGFIEAHGTGTVLGDAIEVAALTRVFRESTTEVGLCRLGSVKTNVGHMASAAGVAGLIKASLALQTGLVPPTVNFTQPNPELGLATSPFRVNTETEKWPSGPRPRIAGVSSFGVGGTNVHVVLQETPTVSTGQPTKRTWHAHPISAKSPGALRAGAAQLSSLLTVNDEVFAAEAAYTLAVGRQEFEHRAVLISGAKGGTSRFSVGASAERAHLPERPRIAFLFPGQGAQYAAMASELYSSEPEFKRQLDQCLSIFGQESDLDLEALLLDKSKNPKQREAIRNTAAAQPALFITSYSLAKLLESFGVTPDLMLGHSVGEYVAACLAGVLSLPDAISIVTKRGALMQSVNRGEMLAVSLKSEQLAQLLPPGLDLAAINAPLQSVVAGPQHEIDAFKARLKALDIPCQTLQTSHAFHSRSMDPVIAAFEEAMSSVARRSPTLTYISSLSGQQITLSEIESPDYWSRQLRSTVQFSAGVGEVSRIGASIFIEVGPGGQLCSLARQARGKSPAAFIQTMPGSAEKFDSCHLARALSELWVSGGHVKWEAAYAGEDRRIISSLPSYAFQRSSFWTDPQIVPVPIDKAKRKDPADWLYAPTWIRTPRLDVTESWTGQNVLLLSANRSLAQQFASILRERGATISFAERLVADEANEILNGGAACQRVILLCDPQAPDNYLDSAEFLRAQDAGIFALLKTLGVFREIAPLQIDIVGGAFFEVVGDELVRPDLAPMLGFAAVVPQEHQNVRCRVVDVEFTKGDWQENLERVLDILAAPVSEPFIALRNGYCWTRLFSPIPRRADEASIRTKAHGIYLITGGLGEIGAVLAEFLAATAQARLILVGRRPVPPRSKWMNILNSSDASSDEAQVIKAIQEVEARGGQVWTFRADVSNRADMHRLRKFIETEIGKLDGAILAAGKLGLNGTQFDEKTSSTYYEHFEAKTLGVMNFALEFGDLDLDFCVLISSLSTILGGLGHCAYAAANHAADALICRRNRGQQNKWIFSSWDLWRPRGKRADLSQVSERIFEAAIQPEEGKALFARMLSARLQPQMIICTRDLSAQYEQWVKNAGRIPVSRTGDPLALHARPAAVGVFEAPAGEIEEYVAGFWCEALGLEQVGRNDNFFALGGHSLLTVQILAKATKEFGIEVPVSEALQAPTVREFAELVEALIIQAMARAGNRDNVAAG